MRVRRLVRVVLSRGVDHAQFGTQTGVVSEITGAGVEFARHDGLDFDDNGITARAGGGRIAWFRDPDGDTLAVVSDA